MKQPLPLLKLAALLLAAPAALAQTGGGVGIGTTAPDASAALDIVSSSKGVLLPRVADAMAITSPATGLIVFQTGSPAGFYYNAGTPTAPSWQQLATTAGGAALTAAANGLSATSGTVQLGGSALTKATDIPLNGQNLTFSGTGNVGIGTSNPVHPLTVQAPANDTRLLGFNDASGTDRYNFSRTNPVTGSTPVPGGLNLSESNVAAGRLFVQDGTGNVGIGTTAPGARLQVAGGLKISGSGNGLTFPDGTTQTTALSGNSAILNQNTPQASSNFNISGNGIVGGSVGVGTGSPTAQLDVNGSTRLRGLSTAGVVTTDANGNLSSQPLPAGESTTASNGLTLTGSDVRLGGTLTQNTTLVQAGNSLTVAPVSNAQQLSQPIADTQICCGPSSGFGQSFTLPAGATITQVDVYAGGGSGTFKLYQGAPGGTALASQTVSYAGGQARTSVILAAPVTITTAGTYSFNTGVTTAFAVSGANPYAGGTLYAGNSNSGLGSFDLKFAVYYTVPVTPTLYAGSSGSVGVGTGSPTAQLDVNGSTRLRGLSTAGVVTTDANGNLSSSSATATFGDSFVQNTTSQQAGSNFNISGTGVVGSSLGVGTVSPTGRLTVQTTTDTDLGLRLTDGSASNLVLQGLNGSNSGFQYLGFNGYYANGEQRFNTGRNRWRVGIDQRSTDLFFVDTYDGSGVTTVLAANKSGQVGVGTTDPNATLDVNGGLRVRNLTTAGVVMADANGRLSSAAPASLGNNFIQNQGSAQQAGSFNISGNATIAGSTSLGGQLTIGAGGPAIGRVLTAINSAGVTNWAYPGVLASLDVTVANHYEFVSGPSVRLLRVISASNYNQLNLNATPNNVENQELVVVNLQANSVTVYNSAQAQTVLMNLGQNQAARFIYAGGNWLREQ